MSIKSSFLSSIFLLLIACPPGGPPAPVEPPPPAAVEAAAAETCGVDKVEGDGLAFTQDFKGTPATLTLRSSRGPIPTWTQTYAVGGVVAMDIRTSRPDESRHVIEIDYAGAFGASRQLRLQTRDGKKFTGTLDGAGIELETQEGQETKITFASGEPGPLTVEADLQKIFFQLNQKSRDTLEACGRSEDTGRSASGLQSTAGHISYTTSAAGCVGCRIGAIAGGGTCVAVAAGACTASGPFWGLCFAVAAAGCGIASIVAIEVCWAGVCCPQKCGQGHGACCFKEESCLNPDKSLCCGQGLSTCGGKSCCAPSSACIPATGVCCESSFAICNNVCCSLGEKCTANGCCANGCGNVCCGSNKTCINPQQGTCCEIGHSVCDGKCCSKPTDKCVNGDCCSAERICGSVCCAAGTRCTDPASGRCEACAVGLSVCAATDQCSSSNIESHGNFCCPPGVRCCKGGCCAPGEVCSRDGCRPQSVCVQ